MGSFDYLCIDDQGARRQGTLDAPDRSAAERELKERGWTLLRLGGEEASAGVAAKVWRLSGQERSRFLLKISLLMQAGVPIVTALQSSGRDESPEFSQWTSLLAGHVSQGHSLSQALIACDAGFDGPTLAIVKLGEQSGRLVSLLAELAESSQRQLTRSAELRSKLTYPAVQLVVVGLVCLLMGSYTGPQLIAVIDGLGVEQPALTRWVSYLMSPKLMLPIVLLTGLAVLLLVAGWATPAGRQARHHLETALPYPLARLREELLLMVFCRNLALLLDCGFDWRRSLELNVTGASDFDTSVSGFREGLQARDFPDAVADTQVFPPLLKSLLVLGYEAHRIPRFLRLYADMLEESTDHRVSVILSVLEPLLLAVLGVVVGVVVVASFLPILGLVSKL